jgi:hypothetical protein
MIFTEDDVKAAVKCAREVAELDPTAFGISDEDFYTKVLEHARDKACTAIVVAEIVNERVVHDTDPMGYGGNLCDAGEQGHCIGDCFEKMCKESRTSHTDVTCPKCLERK